MLPKLGEASSGSRPRDRRHHVIPVPKTRGTGFDRIRAGTFENVSLAEYPVGDSESVPCPALLSSVPSSAAPVSALLSLSLSPFSVLLGLSACSPLPPTVLPPVRFGGGRPRAYGACVFSVCFFSLSAPFPLTPHRTGVSSSCPLFPSICARPSAASLSVLSLRSYCVPFGRTALWSFGRAAPPLPLVTSPVHGWEA